MIISLLLKTNNDNHQPKGGLVLGWRWLDADVGAVVVRAPDGFSVAFLASGKSITAYLVSDNQARKILDPVKWRCDKDILVPEVLVVDNVQTKLGPPVKMIRLPSQLKKARWEVERYQVARIQNLEEILRREQIWSPDSPLGRDWLEEKVREVKSSGSVLVFKNHFARDLEGNLVFPRTPCSQLTSTRLLAWSLPVRALVSYPGSGNTWFRDLVTAATGLHTGNERDWDLRDMSEWTLMQSGNDHQAGADLLVKSHHMRFSRC